MEATIKLEHFEKMTTEFFVHTVTALPHTANRSYTLDSYMLTISVAGNFCNTDEALRHLQIFIEMYASSFLVCPDFDRGAFISKFPDLGKHRMHAMRNSAFGEGSAFAGSFVPYLQQLFKDSSELEHPDVHVEVTSIRV